MSHSSRPPHSTEWSLQLLDLLGRFGQAWIQKVTVTCLQARRRENGEPASDLSGFLSCKEIARKDLLLTQDSTGYLRKNGTGLQCACILEAACALSCLVLDRLEHGTCQSFQQVCLGPDEISGLTRLK